MGIVTQAEKILLGDSHEAMAAAKLESMGCKVENLNLRQHNYPHDDLEIITPDGEVLRIQVKKSRQSNGLLLGGSVYRTSTINEQFRHLNRNGFIISYNHLGDAYIISYRNLLSIIQRYFDHYYRWQDLNGRSSRKNTCLLIHSTASKAGIDFSPYKDAWDQIVASSARA
jgi:hypothetical protein